MAQTETKPGNVAVQESGITIHALCRLCGSPTLTPVLSLGSQYVSDFLDPNTAPGQRAPLELVLCNAENGGCGLLQLRHTVDQDHMYRNYWYRSGVNQTMRMALADVTEKAEQLVHLKSEETVIDTGSNDNTLLLSYPAAKLRKVGFEPAKNLMPYASHPEIHVINDYFSAETFRRHYPKTQAKVVTSIAMFYDLEDPNQFTADVKSILGKDGLWVIQMMYLPTMLEENIFDNICHEHLEYYSLLSLESLLSRHNLKIIDIALNDVNGGSYRTYVTHADNTSVKPFEGAQERVEKLRQKEQGLRLDTAAPYEAFAQRVEEIKQEAVDFITTEVKSGKTVYVYGASTKGNTLLQYFGLDNSVITAAAERNPDKWGKVTVGTNIPIISEDDARAAKPDYFLVLPWHFLKEFLVREKEYLDQGGQFIVPLPKFQVISR